MDTGRLTLRVTIDRIYLANDVYYGCFSRELESEVEKYRALSCQLEFYLFAFEYRFYEFKRNDCLCRSSTNLTANDLELKERDPCV